MIGRLIAILTFRRRPDSITGAAKVIDGDTIVVAGELVRLQVSTRPNWTRRSGGLASVGHDVVRRPPGTHSRRQGSLQGALGAPVGTSLYAIGGFAAVALPFRATADVARIVPVAGDAVAAPLDATGDAID